MTPFSWQVLLFRLEPVFAPVSTTIKLHPVGVLLALSPICPR